MVFKSLRWIPTAPARKQTSWVEIHTTDSSRIRQLISKAVYIHGQ